MFRRRNAHKILIGKPEDEKPPGRHRHRLEDNIRMDLTGTGYESVDWIHVVYDRDHWRAVLNKIMKLWVP
jgi:hypothetical protein